MRVVFALDIQAIKMTNERTNERLRMAAILPLIYVSFYYFLSRSTAEVIYSASFRMDMTENRIAVTKKKQI